MSDIKFLRSDDPFDEGTEYSNEYRQTTPVIQTLEDLISNKSRREFVYEQVYQKKVKQSQTQQKQKSGNSQMQQQSTLYQISRARYDTHERVNTMVDQEPSNYTRISQQLLKNTMHAPQHSVSSILHQHSQDKNPLFCTKQKNNEKRADSQHLKNQRLLSERLCSESDEIQNKRQFLQQQHNEQLKQECTFKPDLSATQNSSHQRIDKENFYKFQENFIQKKQQKIQKVIENNLEKEKESFQEKPEISKKSQKLAEGKYQKQGIDSLLQRLVLPKQCDISKTLKNSEVVDSQFQPQINEKSANLKRNQNIEEILFQDAARRKMKQQNSQQNAQIQTIQMTQYKQNKNSKNAFIKKFIRQFNQITDQIQEFSNSNFMKFQEMVFFFILFHQNETLIQLGFLKRGVQSEREIIENRVWNDLNGSQNDSILVIQNLQLFQKRNLLIFLLAVQNLYEDKLPFNNQQLEIMKKDDINQIQSETQTNLGIFDKFGNLKIKYEDVEKIHNKYNILYNNRLSIKTSDFKSIDEKFSYHPQINVISSDLAQNRRQKIIEHIKNNETENVTIDLNLLNCYQQKQTQLQLELLRQQNEEMQLKQCSFKPNIQDLSKEQKRNNKTNEQNQDHQTRSPKKLGGVHRTLELYNLAKPNNQKKDKPLEVIEYERDCNECTFCPDISNQNRSTSESSFQLTKKTNLSTQKNILRLQKARIDQKVQQYINEKGSTINQTKLKEIEEKIKQDILKEMEENEKKKQELIPKTKINQNFKQSKIFKTYENNQESNKLEEEQNSNPDYKLPKHRDYRQRDLEENRVPLLFVDVNIQEGQSSRIVVYEGDESEDLANKFAQEFNLDNQMKQKLKELLDLQINSLLTKIDEELGSEDEENK